MSDPWQNFRKRARVFWCCFLLYPVVGSLTMFALAGTGLVPFVVLPLMGVALYAGHRRETFPCPRCRQLFFRSGIIAFAFATKCLNCGLPKWSAPMDAGLASDELRYW